LLRDDRAIVPGSFDPVTRGHLDVIRRAARLFDRLVVGVLQNPGKSALFSVEERLALLRAELADIAAIEVLEFGGLAVHLAARHEARWIVRGVRSAEDAAAELPMAASNRRCGAQEVETILLPASAEVSFVSARLVRQIAANGGELGPFVTERVAAALRRKFA
jgi:pantetheine-phosphate adenylyltransferase